MTKTRLKKRIITINKLIDDFELEKKESGLSQKTLSNYHYSLKIINLYYDSLPIAQYNQELCDEFVSWYHENRPTTNATKNADFRNINVFHKWLFDKGYTTQNIHIKMTKEERKIKQIPTDQQIKRLIQSPTFDDLIDAQAWLMSVFTVSIGLRISSLINIQLDDIDFQHRKIKIRHMKNHQQMTMPMSSKLKKAIELYLDYVETTDYLFTKANGEKLTQSIATNYCKRYYKSLGLDFLHHHLLRHYFASNYIKNGGNVFQLSLILNHSSVAITQRYLRSLQVEDFADEINKYSPY